MWLITEEARRVLSNGGTISAEQRRAFEARVDSDETPAISVSGGVAEIQIEGVLTNKPDWFAELFGGGNTTYQSIVRGVAQAEQDSRVKEIVLRIGSSPGGHIDGLFRVVDALKNATKPIKAVVADQAASAAYAIVAQADRIVAGNRATRFGSIGVAVQAYKSPVVYDVASANAPKKRPDPSTEEGRAIMREELDALHALFAGSVAEGRNVSIETVNADFGQGAIVLAEEAIKRGMIDEMSAPRSTKLEACKMDLNEFKTTHPELYNSVLSEGVAQERDRVMAHVVLGKQSGDMETALSAIEGGDEMTATLTAKYLAHGMKRSDIGARDADETEASAADGAAVGTEVTPSELVLTVVEAAAGVEGVSNV